MLRALPLLLTLLSSGAAVGGEFEATDEEIDALLADYRSYGLPWLPKEARLVRMDYGAGTRFKGVTFTPSYVYGFATGALKPGGRNRIFVGLSEVEVEKPVEHVDGKAFDAEHISLRERQWRPANSQLVVAIQCHARGFTELAKAIIQRTVSSRSYWRHVDRQVLRERRTFSLRSLLAVTAAEYWYGMIRVRDSDWREIERNLYGVHKSEFNLNRRTTGSALEGLRASLAPRTFEPGSVEALIDDLVGMRQEFGVMAPDEVTAPEYLRILGRGFDAVPALIEHLDDKRMTRSVMVGFNNFRTYSMRLRQIASEILRDIAVQGFDTDWLLRQKGYVASRESVERWWTGAREAGERDWMLGHLTCAGDDGAAVARGPIRVVARKYPDDLGRAIESLRKAQPRWGWDVAAAAILESGLKFADKESLLRGLKEMPVAASGAQEGLYLLSLASDEVSYEGTPPRCLYLPVSDDSPLLERAREPKPPR